MARFLAVALAGLLCASSTVVLALRQDTGATTDEALSAVFDAAMAEGTPLTPMEGLYTASKFQYDPRPGRDFESQTVIDMLEAAAAAHPEKIALRAPHQDQSGNLVKKDLSYMGNLVAKTYKYTKYTWKEYRDLVMTAAAAFVSMGLQPMDAVNIRGVNSPEWMIAFLGCIAAGGLPVGLYPTDSPEILEFKAKDSGAAFIVVARVEDLQIYSNFVDQVESVKGMVLWDGKGMSEPIPPSLLKRLSTSARPVLLWQDFLSKGQGRSAVHLPYEVQQRIANIKPGQASTVVYTSGTTGNPKGVMLSHDSLTWVAQQTASILTERPKHGEHRIVSYLPLNHVAGQMLDVIFPIYTTQFRETYGTIFFPAMCYLKKRCIKEQLTDAKPTIFLGVPEVWDGLRLKIEMGTASGLKKWMREKHPAVVLKGVGLHKVKYAITGAGPITKDTLWFFRKMGIDILNIFAQSESAALGTAWALQDFEQYDLSEKFGSIGKALGNELRIVEGNSEIQLKGRNLMLGYLNRMDKTSEAITEDGWLRTGDKGRRDKDGFVFLVGRLKEIMKSFGGEMIAPVAVEEGIKKACNVDGQIVKQAVVQGDGAYYLSVLVTLVEDAQDGIPTGSLAGVATEVDPAAQTVADAQQSQVWANRLATCIATYNAGAAKSPEKVWRYAILPRDITAESSPTLMTPTFKIRREHVSAEYSELIASCNGPYDGQPKARAPVRACGKQ
jgi:long-chain-fatty-acid--CoA ligase ACSBG